MYFNARTKNHLRRRLVVTARDETSKILIPLKKFYPQLKNLTVAYEDVPTAEMLKAGVRIESEAHYNPDKKELSLFLFNLYLLADNNAGNFRMRIRGADDCKKRIRNSILQICGD
ncbi:hypothetical protein MEO41_28170, partial [Dolichospermum sp. ST_sed4]|nr:hypothetical protein [Dolichospermum sp. ST_sed4]